MILQRYVFRELVLHFLFTLVAVTGIFVIALGVQTLNRYSVLPLIVVVKSFPYFIPYSFTYTMPMALLVAVVLTYARMSHESEILAIRTAGIHLYPLVAPAICLGLILSLGSFWVNDRLIPYANVKKRAIEQSALVQIVKDIGSGKSSAVSLPNLNLTWEKARPDGTLLNPMLIQKDASGEVQFKVLAKSAHIRLIESDEQGLSLHIDFDHAQTFMRRPVPRTDDVPPDNGGADQEFIHPLVQFEHFAWEKPLDELFESAKKPEDRRVSELIHLSRLGSADKSALWCRCEIHRRLAFSGAFLAFVLVGAPLGILFRRAGRMAALLASFLIVMIGYYPLFMLGQALSERETVPPSIGYWIADVVVSLVGVVLLVRVFRQ
ncbi:MAG: LptF/LptG family permease [Planctomycetes bacterium]|nr:LptF/LptG family permease [Planctomycetota bacterium]